jgi:NtrC-family two-component system response regulator AlgB
MQRLLAQVDRAASLDAPILLHGERGTGKRAVARRLYALGRRSGPFVYIEELGALDDVKQAELLRVCDSERVIAATRCDPERRVRPDLLARFLELRVPPLRERREDILPLAQRYLEFFSRERPVKLPELALDVQSTLQRYAWPGNLRELGDVMERAALLNAGTRIDLVALPEAVAAATGQVPVVGGEFSVADVEREHILRVIAQAGTQEEASRILGIDSSTLWRKRKRYQRRTG